MSGLNEFCARIGIDAAAVRQALAARAGADDAPWYMQAVLGIGAWVTAIASLFFVGVMMDLVLDIDEPNAVVALIGIVLFAFSLRLLHRKADGAFTGHMAVAFAVAGTLLAAAGIAFPLESLWVAVLVTLPFAAATIWQQRSILLQFLVVSIALILAIVAAWHRWDHMITDLAAVTMPIGVALLLYPPRLDVRPAAFALLVVPQGVELLITTFEQGWTLWHGWPAKAALLIVFGFLIALNLRRMADGQRRLMVLAGVAAAIAVALLLPTGAAVGLVLMLLAYTLGSRSLAIIGALAEIYFIGQFYADFQSTLLTKSIILMVAGAVLLLCYGLLAMATRTWRQA